MTVNELNTLTRKLIQQGYGTKSVYQAFDWNYSYVIIGGKVEIKEDGIYFMCPDRSEE